MGIREDIQSGLKDAFDNELADVVVKFNLFRTTMSDDYDVETGTRQEIKKKYPSRGVFGSSGKVGSSPTRKDDDNVETADEELTVIGNEIETNIRLDDLIITDGGLEYIVISPNPVMGGGSVPIIYEVKLRRNA